MLERRNDVKVKSFEKFGKQKILLDLFFQFSPKKLTLVCGIMYDYFIMKKSNVT